MKSTNGENAVVRRVLEGANESTADESADLSNVGDEISIYTIQSTLAMSDLASKVASTSSAETKAYQGMTER